LVQVSDLNHSDINPAVAGMLWQKPESAWESSFIFVVTTQLLEGQVGSSQRLEPTNHALAEPISDESEGVTQTHASLDSGTPGSTARRISIAQLATRFDGSSSSLFVAFILFVVDS
jgi:hypothetical protein